MNEAGSEAKRDQHEGIKLRLRPEDIQFIHVGSSIALKMPHFSVGVPRSMTADCFQAVFLKHLEVVLDNAIENVRKAELAAKTVDSEKVRGVMEELQL